MRQYIHFNPRAPCGARLLVTQFTHMADEFQSTRPVRGATITSASRSGRRRISIHAPRAGRDGHLRELAAGEFDISIHAPRAGRDKGLRGLGEPAHISIHAPRAGRDTRSGDIYPNIYISIHAPRAGRDTR